MVAPFLCAFSISVSTGCLPIWKPTPYSALPRCCFGQILTAACIVINAPRHNTAIELTTGIHLPKMDTCGILARRRPPFTNSSPTVISTPARPRLKTVTRTMPNPTRPRDTAASSNISAAGQGSRPPDMPKPKRERQVTAVPSAPEGRWEWPYPLWLW